MRYPLILSVLLFVLSALPCAAEPTVIEPGDGVFARIVVENGDEGAEVSWEVQREDVVKVTVSRLRTGIESAFHRDQLIALGEKGRKGSWELDDLENGQLYGVALSALSGEGKVLQNRLVFVYPGEKMGKSPKPVEYVYTRSGAQMVALFWKPSEQQEVAGYEILRQYRSEDTPVLVAQTPKMGKVRLAPNAPALSMVVPSIWHDKFGGEGERKYGVRVVDRKGARGELKWTDWTAPRELGQIKPEEVLLLVNDWNEHSSEVAEYYAKKRSIPKDNILTLTIKDERKYDYDWLIGDPVREYLLKTGKVATIRLIVPCYGMPLMGAGRAVDSKLSDPFDRYTWGRVLGTPNPYFKQEHRFEGLFGTYLVGRVDGPTQEIAKSLVDKALEAEATLTPKSGRFFFTAGEKGYEDVALKHGVEYDAVKRENMQPVADDTLWAIGVLQHYYPMRTSPWPVGAIAAWLKSDTLMFVRKPPWKDGHKPWGHMLLMEGITATYGAAMEPYREGYTNGEVFIDRFFTGEYTLAESFGMATPTLQWAMVLVGDPLYRLKLVGK